MKLAICSVGSLDGGSVARNQADLLESFDPRSSAPTSYKGSGRIAVTSELGCCYTLIGYLFAFGFPYVIRSVRRETRHTTWGAELSSGPFLVRIRAVLMPQLLVFYQTT